MDPIGASRTWRWYGYDNSRVLLDGEAMQSVSGGAHWGGGLIISARDMAIRPADAAARAMERQADSVGGVDSEGPKNDLVIVLRWIQGKAVDGVVARTLAAIE